MAYMQQFEMVIWARWEMEYATSQIHYFLFHSNLSIICLFFSPWKYQISSENLEYTKTTDLVLTLTPSLLLWAP